MRIIRDILIILISSFVGCLTACADGNSRLEDVNRKAIVVYFSATGITETVAGQIASIVNADILEIEPVIPYTRADLDWTNKESRSSLEMSNPDFRPSIKNLGDKMNDYNIVFIGYPIWWNLAPTVVNTFVENNNLNGKTVVPFATSGGSSITNSVAHLKKLYPEINWAEGKLLNACTEETIANWIESLKL